jgi:hypothetical protein
MKKQVLTLATFAFILACGAAFAEEGPGRATTARDLLP